MGTFRSSACTSAITGTPAFVKSRTAADKLESVNSGNNWEKNIFARTIKETTETNRTPTPGTVQLVTGKHKNAPIPQRAIDQNHRHNCKH